MHVLSRSLLAAAAASFFVTSGPALAGRTAIDQDPDGNPTMTHLSGYCDLNGEDCSLAVGLSYKGAAYSATFADGSTFDSFFVHGNGLLTFGSSIDFGFPDDPASFYSQIVYDGVSPEITSYSKTLVSVGQNNQVDPLAFGDPYPFFQSADYGIDSQGRIFAEYYTCFSPGAACHGDVQRLTLTPTSGGFAATISGASFGTDRGYVVGGAFHAGGSSFFIPANFNGITLAVPEPATWAMMITGFGLAGLASRRRRNAKLSYG